MRRFELVDHPLTHENGEIDIGFLECTMSFSSNVFLLLRCRLWITQYGTRTELIFSSSNFSVCSIESIAYNCYRCFRERVFFWMYFIFLEWTLNWWNRHTHKEIQTPKTTHKHTQTRKSQLAVSPCEVVLRWTSTLWKVCLLMVSSGAAWQRRPEPKATGTEKLKSIEMWWIRTQYCTCSYH